MIGEEQVCSAYLTSVEEAGLLHDIEGERYASGFYREPVTHEPQILMEYVSSRILGDPQLLGELEARLSAEHPEARRVLLRVPGEAGPALDRWVPYLSYVQLGPELAPGETTGVRPAQPEDEPLVRAWIATGLWNACEQQGRPPVPGAAEDVAQQILDSPGRETLVYVHEGRTVAHLTMMADSHEEVSGQDQVEMIDVLADDAPDPRTAQRNLVNAAARRAREVRRPLVGNVVHTMVADRDEDHGRRIIGRLREQGWFVTHELWSLTIDTGTDQP